MIDFSGRITRAGTRGIAAAAVSCFTVMPQFASHQPAHADGPVGSTSRAQDHRPAGREHDARSAGHRSADSGRGPVVWQPGDHPVWPDRGHDAAGQDHGSMGGKHDRKGRHFPPRARVVLDTQGPRGAVIPGRTYTWPYSVTNTGPAPVRHVTLTTKPNQDLKIVAMPPKCRWRDGRDLVCRIGILPAGQTKRGALTAMVDPKTPTGRTLSSPAKVSWEGRPRSAAREMAFPPVTASQPTDLAVSGDALPETVRPGGEVPYEISVTNEGPVTAEAVVVRSSVANDPGDWPCASTVDPARTLAGKNEPVKPAVPPCAAAQDSQARPMAQAPAAPPCAPLTAPRCGADVQQPACSVCTAQQSAPQQPMAPQPVPQRPVGDRPAVGQACGACAAQQPAPACGVCAAQQSAPQQPMARQPVPQRPLVDPPAVGPACGVCAAQQSAPQQPMARQPVPQRPVGDRPAVGQACGACAAQQGVPACGSVRDGSSAGDVAGRPVAAPCGPSPDRIAAEPGRPAGAGDGIHRSGPAEAPIGPGIVPDRPGKTGVDTPVVIGKDHHCVAQGPGFVCPLGAIPPGKTRKLRLAVRERPHAHPGRLRCLSTVESGTPDENPANNTVACHTRNARPMSAPEHPGVNRLPQTGFPFGTVALAGLGLAAVGFVLLRIGRARRGEEV
ncbi:MAG: hypothetical protein ACJ72W_00395 [Actinoallomurus sp.]